MPDLKRIILSDNFWFFRYGLTQEDIEEDPGLAGHWFEGLPVDKDTFKVYVPSAWSYYQNRQRFYHFGTGWYETSIYMPHEWGSADGKKCTLAFHGANYKTTVWINGRLCGFHEGGYTKFWFEINEFVKFGQENKLVVQVDNRYAPYRLPWFQCPEWMNFGGLFRPIYLKLTSQVCIDDIKITNNLRFPMPLGQGSQGMEAKILVRTIIKDARPLLKGFEGSLLISVKNQKEIDSVEIPVKFKDIRQEYINAEIPIKDPQLWSPETPHLYSIRLILIDKKDRKELDQETLSWGIRTFQIQGKDFYLNNQKYILRGVNHHDDHPDVGPSMSPRLIYNDLNIMKDAHINCIRTSHYPPYDAMLEFTDELGFIILEEIPVYGLKKIEFQDPRYLIAAQQQLWEMIHRDKNHCSVVAWILSSDCDLSVPEGMQFMKNLYEIGKEIDPFRYFSWIAADPMADLTMGLSDFVCIKAYTGWFDKYNVPAANVEQVFKSIWQRLISPAGAGNPKPLIIAEFGAAAISGFYSFANGHWSENYQYDFLRTYLNIIRKCEFISGGCIYCFQDFRCSPFQDFLSHPKEYINNGIVDMYRNPKISYYIVQSQYEKWKPT